MANKADSRSKLMLIQSLFSGAIFLEEGAAILNRGLISTPGCFTISAHIIQFIDLKFILNEVNLITKL